MALAVGTKAPDFTLRCVTNGEIGDFNLAEGLKSGPIVLLFFPGAFTNVCQKEMCEVSQQSQFYSDRDATVVGISVDSVYALRAWAKTEGITVSLLSDYCREVTELYDAVWPNFSGMGPCSARVSYVIAQNGDIVFSEHLPLLGDFPDMEGIEQAVNATKTLNSG